jgi:hypothetical protein
MMMLRRIYLTVIALFSLSAMAYQPEFPTFVDFANHLMPQKLHDCMVEAWLAAGTPDDLTAQAQKALIDARGVLGSHQAPITSAIDRLNAAWAKYPVSPLDVGLADMILRHEIEPVQRAFSTAALTVLNLMSADQRKLYDADFKVCIAK